MNDMKELNWQIQIHSRDCAGRLTGEKCDCVQPKAAAQLAALLKESDDLRAELDSKEKLIVRLKNTLVIDNHNHPTHLWDLITALDEARKVIGRLANGHEGMVSDNGFVKAVDIRAAQLYLANHPEDKGDK
jgi:hypothetical protein